MKRACRRRRSRFRRFISKVAVAGAGLTICGVAAFYLAVYLLPYPEYLAEMPLESRRLLFDDDSVAAEFVAPDGQWRSFIPESDPMRLAGSAVVAVEDCRFYSHSGVDWSAVCSAVVKDCVGGGIKRGASTITMQLEKLRNPGRRSWIRKIEQAVRAEQIERVISKSRILREYLNRLPMGGNVVGWETASYHYFGIPSSKCSLAQAALLAGIPQSPERYRPDLHPTAGKRRRDFVLKRMMLTGEISQAAFEDAVRSNVECVQYRTPQSSHESPVCGAISILADLANSNVEQLVTTTLRRSAQSCAKAGLLALSAGKSDPKVGVVLVDNYRHRIVACATTSKDSTKLGSEQVREPIGGLRDPLLMSCRVSLKALTQNGMFDTSLNLKQDQLCDLTSNTCFWLEQQLPDRFLFRRDDFRTTSASAAQTVNNAPSTVDEVLMQEVPKLSPLQVAEAFSRIACQRADIDTYLRKDDLAKSLVIGDVTGEDTANMVREKYKEVISVNQPIITFTKIRHSEVYRQWCCILGDNLTVCCWSDGVELRDCREFMKSVVQIKENAEAVAAVHGDIRR